MSHSQLDFITLYKSHHVCHYKTDITLCITSLDSVRASPRLVALVACLRTHLEHLEPHVGHGQVDLGTLPVRRRVEPDSVHLQLAGDFQNLEIGFRWSLSTGERESQHTSERSLTPCYLKRWLFYSTDGIDSEETGLVWFIHWFYWNLSGWWQQWYKV